MNSPCKGCSERAAGCHGHCKDYKAFRKERDQYIKEHIQELNTFFNLVELKKQRR